MFFKIIYIKKMCIIESIASKKQAKIKNCIVCLKSIRTIEKFNF